MDEVVCLGAALAARAPRLGHVCVDLASIASSASTDSETAADLGTLAWPETASWVDRMAASSLVGDDLPLHLMGSNLYLDRLWADEVLVATDLLARAAKRPAGVDEGALASDLSVLFPAAGESDLQSLAAVTAVRRPFLGDRGRTGHRKDDDSGPCVGAPGGAGSRHRRATSSLALAAPTGKAAARLEEAVHGEARAMGVDPPLQERLLQLKGSTLHRLLGSTPGTDPLPS